MRQTRAYLDHAATTPLSDEARDVMTRLLADALGNPSSPHLEGRAAKDLLESARSRMAAALGCRPREVIFTAGGAEACAIALRGAAHKAATVGRRRIVVSAVEHAAVLDTAAALGEQGFEIVEVPVDRQGAVSASAFLEAAGSECAAAALMLANHEMGAVMPVHAVAAGLKEHGTPLLCDAALGPGRLPVSVGALGAPLIAFSAHKFGGPVGTGALYVRRGTQLAPWLRGGIQEERLRPGTEDVVGCMGMATAFHAACAEQEQRSERDRALIATFCAGLSQLDGWSRVGPGTPHGVSADSCALPGLLTLELRAVEGEAVMINMDLEGFAVSTGSTCALGSADPSPGLLAMGMTKQRAASTIRISVGEGVTSEHMRRAASTICEVVFRLRALAQR